MKYENKIKKKYPPVSLLLKALLSMPCQLTGQHIHLQPPKWSHPHCITFLNNNNDKRDRMIAGSIQVQKQIDRWICTGIDSVTETIPEFYINWIKF